MTPTLDDVTVVCGCCVGAPNVIAMDASAVVALTSVEPCAAAVPVTITRTDATPVRGYSVTFGLSTELALCADPNSSILESTLLEGFGTGTQFVVTDHHDGTFTVDDVILDTPCGSTAATGTLFTVDVARLVAAGTGTVTILAVELRDCDNQPLPVDAGAAATFVIDAIAPLPVTELVASQALAGSGPGSTMVMNIGWTGSTSPDAAAVAVYRKGFGFYPEYDDGGGTVPTLDPGATPADAEAADWTLVDVTVDALTADLQATRDVWSYTAFCLDQYGNPSPPAALTVGLPNYILGDVSDGVVVEGRDPARRRRQQARHRRHVAAGQLLRHVHRTGPRGQPAGCRPPGGRSAAGTSGHRQRDRVRGPDPLRHQLRAQRPAAEAGSAGLHDPAAGRPQQPGRGGW